MRKFHLLLVLLALKFNMLFPQMTTYGEYRPRFEYRDGYMVLLPKSAHPEVLVHQRMRVGIKNIGKYAEYNFSAQDVRTWGEENILTDNNSLGVYEAWTSVKLTDSLTCLRN